jgi:hypothetical protein
VKPSDAANDNLIDRTIALWQPRVGRYLSREDARQIAENVAGFFSVLQEWSRAESSAPANDNDRGPVRAGSEITRTPQAKTKPERAKHD